MRRQIATLFATLALLLVPAVAVPQLAYAADPSCGSENSAKGQVLQGIGQTGNNCDDSGVNNTISTIVEILSIIVGFAAIIMIIVSGIRFITSNGDSGKVAGARSALIYSLVGLAVAALAQILVRLVLYQTSK